MLVGFLILDPNHFPLFEYFNEKQDSQNLLNGIEQNNFDENQYHIDKYQVVEVALEKNLYAVIIYLDEVLFEEYEQQIQFIASKVFRGDKFILRQLLSCETLKGLQNMR